MASKTLSQKIIETVGDNDGFDETREFQVKELLKPTNYEKDKKKTERKSFWH